MPAAPLPAGHLHRPARVAALGARAAQGRMREAWRCAALGVAGPEVQLIAQHVPHIDATSAQLAQVLAHLGRMSILDHNAAELRAGQGIAAAAPIVGVDFLHLDPHGLPNWLYSSLRDRAENLGSAIKIVFRCRRMTW